MKLKKLLPTLLLSTLLYPILSAEHALYFIEDKKEHHPVLNEEAADGNIFWLHLLSDDDSEEYTRHATLFESSGLEKIQTIIAGYRNWLEREFFRELIEEGAYDGIKKSHARKAFREYRDSINKILEQEGKQIGEELPEDFFPNAMKGFASLLDTDPQTLESGIDIRELYWDYMMSKGFCSEGQLIYSDAALSFLSESFLECITEEAMLGESECIYNDCTDCNDLINFLTVSLPQRTYYDTIQANYEEAKRLDKSIVITLPAEHKSAVKSCFTAINNKAKKHNKEADKYNKKHEKLDMMKKKELIKIYNEADFIKKFNP